MSTGIRIDNIPKDSALDGSTDLVHIYKLVGGEFRSVAAPLSAVAFQGPAGTDGTPGTNGVDGLSGNSVAQLVCYKRFGPEFDQAHINADIPGLGANDDGSFNFSSKTFIPPTGWSAGVPAGTDTLYSCNGVAQIVGKTGTDENIEWSDPEDSSGIQGLAGHPGQSTYQAVVFARNDTNPGAPTGGAFDFGTNTLTPPNTGADENNSNPLGTNNIRWYIDVGYDPSNAGLGPPGDKQLWMCNKQFSAPGDDGVDDDSTTAWSVPTRFASDGANGYSTFFGSIYKRINVPVGDPDPARPGNGNIAEGGEYNFTDNEFVLPSTSSFTGWTEEIPAEDSIGVKADLWMSTTVATSNASFNTGVDVKDTDLIWTYPKKVLTYGVDGNQGSVVSQVRAYIRNVGSLPSTHQLSATYFDFTNKVLYMQGTDGVASGWSNAPFASNLTPSDGDYGNDLLYVSVGVASSVYDVGNASYPADTSIVWSDPLRAPDDGEAAISTYLGQIYTRYAGNTDIQAASARPEGGSFNFSNSVLTVPSTDPTGELTWTANIPTGAGQIYVSQRNFAVIGNQGTDAWNENNPWSTPAVLAYDGTAGFNGATAAKISIYYGSDTEVTNLNSINFPNDVNLSVDLNTANSTFGKATKSTTNGIDAGISSGSILSATASTGWSIDLPSNDYVYICEAVAADSDASDSNYIDVIAGTEWSDTVIYRRPGSNGLAGLGTAVVSLYKRTGSASTPSDISPDGDIRYYLGVDGSNSAGDIQLVGSTSLQGWTSAAPDFTNNNDHYLWQINATASSRAQSDVISSTEWGTPVIFSQNPFDLTETTRSHVVQAYKRFSEAPTTNPGACTVILSGEQAGQIQTATLANGWFDAIPAEPSDQQVYITHATAAGTTSADIVSASEWSTPAKWGIVGETGIAGADGRIAKIISLYRRTGRPATVTNTLLAGDYNFDADTFTFSDGEVVNDGWSYAVPAKGLTDKILWSTFATAFSSQSSGTYTIPANKWKTPRALLEDGVTITPVFSSNFGGVSASLDSQFMSGGALTDHTHTNFSDEYTSIDSSELLTKITGGTVDANTLTYIKIKGETGSTGNDGSSSVTIFSDVENPTIGTDNLSYIRSSGSIERNFVTYVNFGPSEIYQSTNDLDLTDSSNQTFINGLNFGNIKGDAGADGVGVASVTRASNGVVTVSYDDSTSDTFTITDGADLTVTDVQRSGETVTMTFSDSTTKTFNVADGVGIGSVTTSKVGTTTTVTIKDDNDVTLRQFDISDGLPGAKGRVLVVYAEDADGTNPSTTIGSREFVKYHEYEGDVAPNISDFAATTGTLSGGFVQFIGPQGITNSIFPIYADDASGTNATVDASSNKPFVTFVESSTPITNSNIPTGQTYIKYLGSDGTSVTIQGSKDNQSELNALISSASIGDSYIGTGSGDLTEGNLYVFDGSTFNNVGTIQGPAGSTGKPATPVYATSSGGAGASLTPAVGKTFIAFVNFTNVNPQDSDIPGGLTYTNFKGTGITSVEKTGSTVKVNFSDGTNDTFTVNDGADLTVTDVQRSSSGTVTMTFSDSTTKTFNVADGVGIGSVTSTKNGTTTTVTIKDDNGTTLKQFQLEDGLPGAAANILVVFADNAAGFNPSLSPGSGANKKRFVKYHEYTGNQPTASTAATGGGFVEYVGADGEAGTPITPIYATSSSGANATLNESSITATHVNFVEGSVTQSGSTFVNTSAGTSITISELTFVKIKGEAGEKGDKGDIGPVGSVPIFSSNANGDNATLEQDSTTPFVFFYTGGAVASDTNAANLKLLGSDGAWTKIAGDSLYIHVKYADRVLTSSDSDSDMTDDPTGKRYIGISHNNTSSDENTSGPGDFTWSLIQGAPGLPDGCQAVYGYSNSDGDASITYLEDENALQLATPNTDSAIGMVYPAVDVTDGRTVQFTVSYKTPDAADTDGVYLRLYEATTDLAEGKDRIGSLTGSAATGNSPLIQGANVGHTYNAGNASSSRIAVNPANSDLENGPVGNNYTTKTITFTPSSNSKYVSLTILNWSGLGTKRLWVKPVRTTIVGAKGDAGADGAHGQTQRIVEIFKKAGLTESPPSPNADAPITSLYNIADGTITGLPGEPSLPPGWSTSPPDAESGKKIYRAVAPVVYDADQTTGTVSIVSNANAASSDWSVPGAWSVGANRTAPVVSRLATYEYLDARYQSVHNDNAPQANYYSFRKKTNMAVQDVNAGYGTGAPTDTSLITEIGQILFTLKGKNDINYTNFWDNLDTAAEFIWKYGASWILFRRDAVADTDGIYTGVLVTVLDHSDNISQIKDLPIFSSDNSAIQAEAVFGYTPSIVRQSVALYRRTSGSTLANNLREPGGTLTFNFTSNTITGGDLNGWSTTPPTNAAGVYLWQIFATADGKINASGSYEDSILTTEWSDPTIFAQDGIDGPAGNAYFQKFLYTRTQTSDPLLVSQWDTGNYKPGTLEVTTKDTGSDTIGNVKINDVTTGVLTTDSGQVWSEDIPPESGGNFLWVIVAPVAQTATTANYKQVLQSSWAEPTLLSKDGVGLNSATIRLYRRSSGNVPSGGGSAGINVLGFTKTAGLSAFEYNFSSGNLNIPANVDTKGWQDTIPETGGNTLWVSRAVASSTGTTDQITWDQWQAPEQLVTDGTGMVYVGSFASRSAYINYINSNYTNDIPPVNSFHIETVTSTVNGQSVTQNVSYLYIGGQNSTDKNSSSGFQQLTIDGNPGLQGADGKTFEFKGVVSSLPATGGYDEGDVVRLTSGNKGAYVLQSDAWELLTSDGEDSVEPGPDGNSVFICYNTNAPVPALKPTKPGNTFGGEDASTTVDGDTWYTSTTPPDGQTYSWMSQKVSQTPTSNQPWSDAIQIAGDSGDPGFRTVNITIFKRSNTRPNIPNSGESTNAGYAAYDFTGQLGSHTLSGYRVLPPTGWSSTVRNAGNNPKPLSAIDNITNASAWQNNLPLDPKDEMGYEWYLPANGSYSDRTTWGVQGVNNLTNNGLALWSSTATVSIDSLKNPAIDTSIFWSRPEIEQINGQDILDDSVDSSVVFGVVKNGGGVQKIVAQDRADPPQLLTQAAYDALADTTAANRFQNYGWRSSQDQGGVDTVQDDTLYLIF